MVYENPKHGSTVQAVSSAVGIGELTSGGDEGGREGSKSSFQDPEGHEALNLVGTVDSHLHSCKEHNPPPPRHKPAVIIEMSALESHW